MKLFEPLNAGGMVIPNRVMVPAMVTRLSGEDGPVNKDITDRYVRYAQGGAGLIVIEAMAVHQAKSGPLLRISDDRFVPGLADLVRRIHDTSDSKVVPQIIHFMKVAKSGWRQTIDMLSMAEIDRIVEEFGDAVARARAAGFDGAELHSAHAYTLASFLSRVNPRTDDYGGETLEGRLHLIGRIFENIRRKVGEDFPVGVRFLADEFIKDGYTVNDAKLIGLRLAQLGAAYLSLSVGGKFEDAIHAPGRCPIPTLATQATAACRATGIRPCRMRIFRLRSKPLSARMASTRRSRPPAKSPTPTTPNNWWQRARSISSASHAACWPIRIGRTRSAAAKSIVS